MRQKLFLTLIVLVMICITSCNRNSQHIVQGPQKYPSGNLEGRRLGGLYMDYLGLPSKDSIIRKTITVDFAQNMANMWAKKIKRADNGKVVVQAADTIVKKYRNGPHTLMTYLAYKSYVNDVVEDLKTKIDWDTLQKKENLSEDRALLVRGIASSFSGEDMVAYLMTELMPSSNKEVNEAVMDFLLQYAGVEYIEDIPAMYDAKTSFGPYQFTEFALFDCGNQKRGASIANQAVTSGQKIPGSVIKLRGDDHYKAAYLFAVHNICLMVKKLNKKELQTLKNVWGNNRDDLFVFCATAHHLPGDAIKAARKWLDNKAKASFETSCNKRILPYAQKTRQNMATNN